MDQLTVSYLHNSTQRLSAHEYSGLPNDHEPSLQVHVTTPHGEQYSSCLMNLLIELPQTLFYEIAKLDLDCIEQLWIMHSSE